MKKKAEYLNELTEYVKQYEPDVNLCMYAIHDVMLPYSPTTLKKDKNKMDKQKNGFVWVVNGKIKKIQFNDMGNEIYGIEILDKR